MAAGSTKAISLASGKEITVVEEEMPDEMWKIHLHEINRYVRERDIRSLNLIRHTISSFYPRVRTYKEFVSKGLTDSKSIKAYCEELSYRTDHRDRQQMEYLIEARKMMTCIAFNVPFIRVYSADLIFRMLKGNKSRPTDAWKRFVSRYLPSYLV